MTAPHGEDRDPMPGHPTPGDPSARPPKRDVYLGGADAVPDTTSAVEHGTRPEGERRTATRGGQAHGLGIAPFVWVVLAIIAIAIFVLLAGGL